MAAGIPLTEEQKAALTQGALTSLAAGQSLRAFCLANKIGYATVWDLLNPEGGDNSAYARAKAAGTHYMADECIDIADDSSGDVTVDAEGNERLNNEFVQRAKVRIDTRLRLIGKWNRRDYGDKVQLSDADGNKLEAPVVQYSLPSNGRD